MAKFKVGQQVLVTIGGKHTGKVGVVQKIVQTSPISDYTYLLSFEGESGNFPINEGGLRAANSCLNSIAANADNPFKVGDIVTHKSFPSDIKFKVVAVTNDLQGNSAMKVEVYKGGFMDSPIRFKKA